MSGMGLTLASGRYPYAGGGAVAPLEVISATSQDHNTSQATQTITLPDYDPGDLLVLVFNNSGASSETFTVDGWDTVSIPSSGSASNYTQAFSRIMSGAEGASVQVTQPVARKANSLIWRIIGHDPLQPLAGTSIFTNTTTATSLDPANLISGFGAVETVWLQYLGTASQDSANGASPVVTAWPAGYDGTGTSTTSDLTPGVGCGQGWCHRIANAASEDAGAWTYNPTPPGSRACAVSIAVRSGS